MNTEITINLTAIIEACDISGREQENAYRDLLNEVEPPFLQELIAFTKGNKTAASKVAGIDRGTLNGKLKHHAITFEKVRDCQ